MSELLLAKDVYFCSAHTGFVFLDLQRDEYSGIPETQTPAMWEILSRPRCLTESAKALAAELVSAGLLTRDPRQGKPLTVPSFEAPHSALIDEANDESHLGKPQIRGVTVSRMFRAYATARFLLRRGPARAVRRVQARNLAAQAHRAFDPCYVRNIVRSYRWLRPIFYAARDRCLLSSLTLLEYLATHGVTANWVFGVKIAPFEAHCWVQTNGFVLNDRPEHVVTYLPILSA